MDDSFLAVGRFIALVYYEVYIYIFLYLNLFSGCSDSDSEFEYGQDMGWAGVISSVHPLR